MMGARDLLADLADAGLTVRVDAGKLLVKPASKLTDDLLLKLRAAKPELLALLTPTGRSSSARTCTACQRLLPRGTCGTPVEAGLIRADYSIIWPTAGYAKTCSAFEPKAVAQARDRAHKLTPAEAEHAHAAPWDGATCARFTARVVRFLRLGFSGGDADDLAERLHLRDVRADDRALCIECTHLAGHASAGWRCRSARAAGIAADLPAALVTAMQRCSAFKDAAS